MNRSAVVSRRLLHSAFVRPSPPGRKQAVRSLSIPHFYGSAEQYYSVSHQAGRVWFSLSYNSVRSYKYYPCFFSSPSHCGL